MMRVPSRVRRTVALAMAALLFHASAASALQPPRPGELEKAAQAGFFETRLQQARQLGNDQVEPSLIWNLRQKVMRAAGAGEAEIAAAIGPAPPPAWQGGLPATGTPKVFVLLVDFPDYPDGSSYDRSDVESKFFGDGDPARYPYESLGNYYRRSSYDRLAIQGTVFNWYRAQHPRSYYQNLSDPEEFGRGQEVLMREAIEHWNNQGHDFSQYDNDNDGTIDAFFVKWTGPDEGWASFWWAYQWDWHVLTDYRVDGKKLGKYVWSWIANPRYDSETSYQPRVDIHETGHLLGLPDLYDYDPWMGPPGGVGGLDMMDANWGDHNCFSKFLLGWLAPTMVGSGVQNLTLSPSGTDSDCVLIAPDAGPDTLFGEFFMAQYRKRGMGNDPSNYPADGMIVWHVDSTLDSDGWDFAYDNSYTVHKYIRLVQADGLEQIEQGFSADAGDFYVPPGAFGSATHPDSRNYAGYITGAAIDELSAPGSTMSGQFAIRLEPDIMHAGLMLIQEACPPGNGVIDPFEPVTVKIALRNTGTAPTTDLTGEVLAAGAVVPLSGPQSFGPLQPFGEAVGRDFSFVARGDCGDNITLELRVQDGAETLAPVTIPYQLGSRTMEWSEDFDGVIAPALPARWTAQVAQGSVASWATVSSVHHTPPNAVFASNPSTTSDNRLISPALPVATASARLTFRHRYNLESSADHMEAYDGGVLEISLDDGEFIDVLDAGCTFATGGYNLTIAAGWGNPLGGRPAWSGSTGGSFITTTVDLAPELAGKTARFRWRLGTDGIVSAMGWYVDTIALEDGFECCDPKFILVSPQSVSVPEGGTASFEVSLPIKPLEELTVSVAPLSGDPDISVISGSTLIFDGQNWDQPQTVTLAAAEDDDAAHGQAIIACSATGWTPAHVKAIEVDNDKLGIEVSTSSLTVPETESHAFQVRLTAAPAGAQNVAARWHSGDPSVEVLAGSVLRFTPVDWREWQTVTVEARKDQDTADGHAVIRLSGAGMASVDVDVYVPDDDIMVIQLSVDSLLVPEGRTAGFPLRLTAQPREDIIVTCTIEGDPDLRILGGARLTFTSANWDIWQTVTLEALPDDDAIAGQALVRCGSPGVDEQTLIAYETDDDAVAVVTDTDTLIVSEMETASFGVQLAAKPEQDVTVLIQVVPGDPDITLVSPPELIFTPAGPSAWNVPQWVVMAAARDLDTVNGQSTVRLGGPGLTSVEVLVIEQDDGIVPPTWYRDLDGDGAGDPNDSMPAWEQPAGYVANDSDCDDHNAEVSPWMPEICGNGIDDNCDGRIDEGCDVPPVDSDGDGVPDDLDQCPDTPAGTEVNAVGCPLPREPDESGQPIPGDNVPPADPSGDTPAPSAPPDPPDDVPSGQAPPPDDEAQNTPVAPPAMCGLGLAESMLGLLLGLGLCQFRRRRCFVGGCKPRGRNTGGQAAVRV